VTKAIYAVATVIIALSAGVAAAQTRVDMAKITCDDLSKSYLDEVVIIGSWMSGYYNAKRNNTKVDVKQLAAATKNVMQFCDKNPKMTVMKAIETLMAPKK
jgi:hypothetical protein